MKEIPAGTKRYEYVDNLVRVVQEDSRRDVVQSRIRKTPRHRSTKSQYSARQRSLEFLLRVFDPIIRKESVRHVGHVRWLNEFDEVYAITRYLFIELVDSFDPNRGVYFPLYIKRFLPLRLKTYIQGKKDEILDGPKRSLYDESTLTYDSFFETPCEDPVAESVIERDDQETAFGRYLASWFAQSPVDFIEETPIVTAVREVMKNDKLGPVLACLLDGMKQQEIAEYLACQGQPLTQQAVSKRVARIRTIFRDHTTDQS